MAETGHTTLESAAVKLSNKERFCYAAGVIGMIIPFNLPLGYLTYYWTDVALIPMSIVATFLMLNKLWDAINDPIIGAMADRTHTKNGRYRPWIIPAGITSNLTCLLLFMRIPGASQTVQTISYFVSYFIFVAAFTALEIPHLAMKSTLTTDYAQRGILTSWRQTSASLVMATIAATYLPMTIYLVPGDRAAGYFYATCIFLAISTPFYFICYYGTKERILPAADEKDPPFSESLKCLKGNKPALMLMGAHLCHGLNGALAGGVGIYFWTYYAGNVLYQAQNATFSSFGGTIAAMLMGVLLKLYPNKRNLGIMAWSFSCVVAVCMYFLAPMVLTPGGRLAWYIINLCRGAIGGVGFVCLFSMVPEVTEYTIAKYGLRASGFIVAIVNFTFKFGTSFGQGASGWILAALGYVPNQPQNPVLLGYLRFALTMLSAIITGIGVLFFSGYKITKESHEELLKTINADA